MLRTVLLPGIQIPKESSPPRNSDSTLITDTKNMDTFFISRKIRHPYM